MVDLHALPTEPLLDESTVGLDRWMPPKPVVDWMADLAEEQETAARCHRLFSTLRKQLSGPLLIPMARGIVSLAVRQDPRGAAALSAFLSVSAPGLLLVERMREFTNLHRQCTLYEAMKMRGDLPGEHARNLLSQVEETDRAIVARWPEIAEIERDKPRDMGPAASCRFAFARLAGKLESQGTLDDEHLGWVIRLARLEITALELRASHLAGSINPYSARHVTQVIPVLSETDADLRDMRDFLNRLAETRRARMFFEHIPAISEHLSDGEEQTLRNLLRKTESLAPVWRLLRSLDRCPIPQPALSYFCDRVSAIGHVLHDAGIRKQPLDLVASILLVFDHCREGSVEFHCSDAVADAIRAANLQGIEVGAGMISIALDPIAARRLSLPHGLPIPPKAELVEEVEEDPNVSVKDLVSANLNNTSVLLGLLKNQKVVNTPGVVAMVAERCRNMRVLDTICTTRALYTGHANKDVPLSLLRSPANIPIKILRRFVNVRYIRKIELVRLARDKTGVRREVQGEVEAYLKSLA